MNMLKVRNSASFVNYIKPELEMVDLEVEGSLLLTASDTQQTSVNINSAPRSFTGNSLEVGRR